MSSTETTKGAAVLPTACFRTPMLPAQPEAVIREVAARTVEEREFSTGSMNSKEIEALSQLVPFMMCGEESAVHVFHRESRRVRNGAHRAAQELLLQIAGEEKVHEYLLARLAVELPEAEGNDAIRKRSQDFFINLANPDPAVHFARVAALDSGVCKIMASFCLAPGVVKYPALQRICSKIRSDESRHVRISRQYVMDLGMPPAALSAAADSICGDLVTLLQPGGKALEDLGVDADHLFRRIKREEI